MQKNIMSLLLAAIVALCCLAVSGCGNRPGKGWKKSGTDKKRGIDHYYLQPSVKVLDKGCIRVKTKLLPSKGNEAVEKSTNVPKAFSVEVQGVIYCDESSFMVLSKEYLDKQGISLKIEKDGGNMEAVVKIKPDQALYPMIQQVCKEAANMKPVQQAVYSAKKRAPGTETLKPGEKPVEKKTGF